MSPQSSSRMSFLFLHHQHQRSNCFLDISRMSFLPSTSEIKLFPWHFKDDLPLFSTIDIRHQIVYLTFHGCGSLRLLRQALMVLLTSASFLCSFLSNITLNAWMKLAVHAEPDTVSCDNGCFAADLQMDMLQDLNWMIHWKNPFHGFFSTDPCGM